MYSLKKRHLQPKSSGGRLHSTLIAAAFLCSLSANLQSRQPEFPGIAEARNAAAPEKGIPAKLRGTVTAFSGWKNSFFLQNATGAISVDRLETSPVKVGDSVEVTGRIKPGLYANVFVSSEILILGRAALPAAPATTYQELKSGDFDSRLVEVTARVHAVHSEEIWARKTLILDLQTGDALLKAYLPDSPAGNFDYLVDSEVRVRGVCGTIFNDRRQLIGLRLFVAGLNQVEVLAKGQDPDQIPESAMNSLLTLHGPPLDRRVRLRGTVTYETPDEVFLQQGNAAIRVLNPAGRPLAVGTQAEAWGFVASNGFSPILQNGFLRATGYGHPLPPIQIKAGNVVRRENGFVQAPYDGLLVHFKAKILDRIPNSGSLGWRMIADGVQFQADIANAPGDWALGFESGAQVDLTGICVNETSDSDRMKSFHILLAAPADMRLVQAPYWTQSLLLVLAAYLSVFVAGLLIYMAQQRQDVDEGNPPVERRSRQVSRALTLLGAGLSIALFLSGLLRFSNPVISISGAALLVAASAIWLLARERSRTAQRLSAAASWLVIATGSLSLVAEITNSQAFAFIKSLGIERIPQVAALSLVLLGCSTSFAASRRLVGFGQFLAVLVVFATWLQMLSVLYGVAALNGLAAHLIMSTPCAITMLALSLAMLAATPNVGLMKTVCSRRLGGFMLRRLMPAAVLIPVAVGWLRLQLQVFGLIDTRLGLTLLALSVAFLFCMLMWSSAAVLNRLDREKSGSEEALHERQHKLDLLIESVKGYAIYMLDRDGRVSSWNAGAERITGYTASEIIGKHYSILSSEEDRRLGQPQRDLATAVAEGRVSGEALRVRKDGQQYWVSTVMCRVYDGVGQVCGFSRVVRDVTEWKQATELLIAAQKRAEEANTAKSSFLAAMSHEIRTPMNAILGMADLLWETELKPIQREYVERFQRAGANLLTLINDILDLSKIESGRFDLEEVDFDLLELVDRVTEIASPKANSKNIFLETEAAPGTPAFLIGDPVRLQQILNNLIGNAIKFTQSGSITLRIGSHPDGRPAHLDFSVTDTGIGIPANTLSAIFEDFTQAESSTTRRFGGTGLGLGICRRLVQKMEGELTVESVFGQGSTFRFDAVLGVSERTTEASPATLRNLSGMHVLVVDDNATNRMIISEMCAGWGMKTRAASSAAQALSLIREAQDPFSLIVLDRLLPGAHGFETLEEIKRFDSDAAVIISSSDHRPGDITEAKALGAVYLMKPVRRAELLSCIVSAVSSNKSTKRADTSGVEPPVDHEPPSLASFRILLADDSEDNRFLVEAYLMGQGCDLSFAENGVEAVEAFRNGQFDVILMDIQMPEMDGLTATTRIRELERERQQAPTTIFALTANALVEDTQRSHDAGCDGHLAKPISKDKLIGALVGVRESILEKSAPKVDDPLAIDIPAGFAAASQRYIKKQREVLAGAQNPDQLRTLGHNMKGTGGSYGFPQLTILGAALEDAAQVASPQQLEAQLLELNRYLEYATHYFSEQPSPEREEVLGHP
jgi:two-component system, sensor histidine kinase and response regulator